MKEIPMMRAGNMAQHMVRDDAAQEYLNLKPSIHKEKKEKKKKKQEKASHGHINVTKVLWGMKEESWR